MRTTTLFEMYVQDAAWRECDIDALSSVTASSSSMATPAGMTFSISTVTVKTLPCL